MFSLSYLIPTLWFGDAAVPYQLGFQDPATTTMEGIYLFNLHLLFVIISILIIVSWLLFSVFTNFAEFDHSDVATFVHSTPAISIETMVYRLIVIVIFFPFVFLVFSHADELSGPLFNINVTRCMEDNHPPGIGGDIIQLLLDKVNDGNPNQAQSAYLEEFVELKSKYLAFNNEFKRFCAAQEALSLENDNRAQIQSLRNNAKEQAVELDDYITGVINHTVGATVDISEETVTYIVDGLDLLKVNLNGMSSSLNERQN